MSQAPQGQGSVRKLAVDKQRMEQINMMRRSAEEAGKFDNSDSTSAPMALSALVGLGLEAVFYVLLFPFVDFAPAEGFSAENPDGTPLFMAYFWKRGWVPWVLSYLTFWSSAILWF